MKKIILTALALTTVICANAANFKVTVSTQERIEWIDKKTNETVATETKVGRTLVFEIVADTPREAENKALNECQGACDSGIPVLAQSDVYKNGKLCDKYVKTVPYSANAVLN